MSIKDIQNIIQNIDDSPSWLSYRRAAQQIRSMIDQHPEVLSEKVKIAILSSFTIEPLVDFLTVEAAGNGINLQPYIAPYGQVGQEILNSASDLYQFSPEMTVLMVEPQSLAENPIAAATELIALVGTWKQNTDTALVLGTFIAQADWPLHILPSEHRQQMIEANDRLKQAFKGDSQVQLCDLDALAAYYGYANALSPEMAAMARIPFAEDFIALLAQKLVSHLKVHCQIIRKCLVLDCDNTLWGGIIGEDGIDGIKLGPDWPGREFVEFQKAILELYEQGVILAINSKNNEADVMAVLREHPHMLLREHHFASISVNWDPKPENMERIADEINIGTDTLVFVDDNPAERTMMQQMLPEVEVLQLPANPALYAKTLRQTNYFAKASLTAEDKKRGQIYAAQRQRHSLQKTTASLEDYLKSLEMICSIRLAEQKDIKRAAQLTQRTNQFNLTTRRYSESDIQQMLENPNWNVYVLGLKDKFGDNGTVGLALVNKQTEAWNGSDTTADLATVWRIDTFLMSCRVIGRQAEDALVDRICRDAVGEGAVKLKAEYRKTAKNDLVAGFWQKMNFQPSRDPDCIGRAGTSQASVYAFELTNYQPKTFEYLTLEEKAEKE